MAYRNPNPVTHFEVSGQSNAQPASNNGVTLVAGSGVTLTTGSGSVTIAASGGGSSESSDSYTLGYATLNASSSGTVSGALTVPAGKTIMAITVDVATGFVHSSGTSYHAGWFVVDGSKLAVTNSSDTLLQPRGAYENYGSVTFSSNYWGAAGVQASAMARLVVGSSDLDIDFKWSNQFNTLTAGSATLKVFYI